MSNWEEISRFKAIVVPTRAQILGISERLRECHATSSHFDIYLLYGAKNAIGLFVFISGIMTVGLQLM